MKKRIVALLGCVLCAVCAACDGRERASGQNGAPYEWVDTVPKGPEASEPPEETAEPEAPNVPQEPPQPPQEPMQPPQEPPQSPAVARDELLRSTANGLQVRSGAGTKYASVGSLDKADMVMPIGKTGNWYEVWYKGTSGYVSAAYVQSVGFTKGAAKIERIIFEGKKLLGMPYVFGAPRYCFGNGVRNTAFTGKSYDCSSLMQYIFKKGANIDLGMTSRQQCTQGAYVAKKNIRRGDLLFFTNAARVNKTGIERIGHVALYLGDNIILHTASDHAVIEPISDARWGYYITARRVVGE